MRKFLLKIRESLLMLLYTKIDLYRTERCYNDSISVWITSNERFKYIRTEIQAFFKSLNLDMR